MAQDATPRAIIWDDLYGPIPKSMPDEGLVKLLALVPDERKEQAEVLLTGLLAAVKAQLTPADYAVFTADMARAYEAHAAGKIEDATRILAAYGIPYEMIAGQLP